MSDPSRWISSFVGMVDENRHARHASHCELQLRTRNTFDIGQKGLIQLVMDWKSLFEYLHEAKPVTRSNNREQRFDYVEDLDTA